MLSVIIPLYNGEKYIKETIESILCSEYSDIEVVVVDDGSTDGGPSIVCALAKDDARVVLYGKENGGVVSARNYGAEVARGEYICFADQDDIVKPYMYSKLIDRLENDGSDLAMCSSGRSIDGMESALDILEDGLHEGDAIRESLLFPILFNGMDVPVKHSGGNHYTQIWTCIFKKSFWEEKGLKFRAYINFEDDYLLKTEALSKASKVSTVSDIGYLWRINLGSETYSKHYIADIGKKQDLEYDDIAKSCREFAPDDAFFDYYKKSLYCKQYIDAIHNLNNLHRKLSRKQILEYFYDNIYLRDFDNCIKGRKLVKKGRIKLRVILPILAGKHTFFSLYAEKILDRILVLSLKSQKLTLLERRLKKR